MPHPLRRRSCARVVARIARVVARVRSRVHPHIHCLFQDCQGFFYFFFSRAREKMHQGWGIYLLRFLKSKKTLAILAHPGTTRIHTGDFRSQGWLQPWRSMAAACRVPRPSGLPERASVARKRCGPQPCDPDGHPRTRPASPLCRPRHAAGALYPAAHGSRPCRPGLHAVRAL